MNEHESELARDRRTVERTHNVARYFTEVRHVAWIALLFSVLFGAYGYVRMPKAKDPEIKIRVAVAVAPWPGIPASRVEEELTRKLERKLADAPGIARIESQSRNGYGAVFVTLKEDVRDIPKAWNEIEARLTSLHDLPEGAGPIQFQKDFGDTSTLMLSVASPAIGDVELELRAREIAQAIEHARDDQTGDRAAVIVNYPPGMELNPLLRVRDAALQYLRSLPGVADVRPLEGRGFLGADVATTLDDASLERALLAFASDHVRVAELSPDVWAPIVIRDPTQARRRLAEAGASKYSYRELDDFTRSLQRQLRALPLVAKVVRTGELPERVYLEYSQAKLAEYGVSLAQLPAAIAARNIGAPGGVIDVAGKNVTLSASGGFQHEAEIGDVEVARSAKGSPVYLRDLVELGRGYETPAQLLTFLRTRTPRGRFERQRAITLSVHMREGAQIADFGRQIDAALRDAKRLLPADLIVRRTSDQPLQVRENVELFMQSLYEAIALVVVVALIGFWQWRAALLLALCIPITLAMTFGMMHALGLDIQQISIASLIIALGLLVDDPIVASDAIKRSLQAGWAPRIAAWLGPTKLAKAILFATVTNIASYLPFLTLTGDTGVFIRSLPIVLSLSLLASRIVSMTFVPLLGYYLLKPEKPAAIGGSSRWLQAYRALVGWAIDHRFLVLGASLLLLAGGGLLCRELKSAFFPKDLSYLSYAEVWLPEDAPLSATREVAQQVGDIIEEVSERYGREHPNPDGSPRPILSSVSEFIGGAAPRFWFSVVPELQQPNYAQLIIQVEHKRDTQGLVPVLQRELSARIAAARVDVRELETGKPVGIPVSLRISGENVAAMRELAERAKAILRAVPGAERVRDDWGADSFGVHLEIDHERAAAVGVTNLDVVQASATALNGATVGELRQGETAIPIVLRLRASERSRPDELDNLYVGASGTNHKIPLAQIARQHYELRPEKILRRDQFRTITVGCFPAAGVLSSEVLARARPQIERLRASLPPGLHVEIGGEAEEQVKSDAEMSGVLGLLLTAIYLALVLQFRHAGKPFIVFAALPYGVVAALAALTISGAPLGFMASLGIISLLGVIVSHIIVLFDQIEEARERGEPMREALIEAGIVRMRPVLITVVATVLGLIPLALHGGPLWEPLCYTQIGGLTAATALTLLLVPVLYTIAVRDLRLFTWNESTVLPAVATARVHQMHARRVLVVPARCADQNSR